ncbi:MAG: VWA domain-containing protein [Myxococcota bacterium]|nr:VWA domain-containing protein [Myxococcota bacterium]
MIVPFLGTVEFQAPSFFAFLFLVPLLWWFRSRSTSGRDPLRSLGSLLGRSAAVACVACALAQPVLRTDLSDRALVVVVDGSGSMVGARSAVAAEEIRALWKQRGEADLQFVLVGEGLMLSSDPSEVIAALAGPRDPRRGTDLRSGLELALSALPASLDRRLVLLSDGAASNDSLDEVVTLAAARGIPLDVRRVSMEQALARVLSVDVQEDLLVGESVEVRVEVESAAAADLRVVLSATDGAEVTRTLKLEAGRGAALLSWRPRKDGLQGLQVHLESMTEGLGIESAPPVEQLVRVRPRPRALIVGPPEPSSRLSEALRGFSPPLRTIKRGSLPPPPYDRWTLIALLNPELAALDRARVDGLVEWVRGGGRLVVTGGSHGLVTDSPRLEGIAELLPVRFPRTKKKERAPLGVIYCLDRSDSMAGSGKFELAAAALAQSLHLLPEQARLGIIGFSDFPAWVLPFGSFEGVPVAIDALGEVEVRGGTSIYGGLRAAYEALESDDSLVKHVLLLSDGQSTTTFSRHGDVVAAMKHRGITVSTIAVSKDSDRPEMERIASAGGGRSYYTESFRDLPRVFLDELVEVTRTNKVEEDIAVYAVEGNRLLRKMKAPQRWPSLQGYIRGHQKAGSSLALATEEGHPLLASGRFGRGVVTLFASDLGGPWTRSWWDWEGEHPFWRSIVEATLDPQAPSHLSLTTRVERGAVWVEFDAVDALQNPRGDLRVEAIVEGLEGPSEVWQLPPVGPGRYGGSLRLDGGKPRLLRVAAVGTTHSSSPPAPGGELLASVRSARPLEFRHPSSNPALLAKLARQTGGRELGTLADVLGEPAPTRPVLEPLWPWLLRLALLFFLVDLTWRRLRVPAWLSRPRRGPRPSEA